MRDSVYGIGELIAAPDGTLALEAIEKGAGLIGIYDENEVLRFSNLAFRDAYFIEKGEQVDWISLMRRNYDAQRGTVIQTGNIDSWLSSVRSRRGKTQLRSYESDLHDGRWIWVVESMLPNGWIAYFGADVTPLNKSERHLRHARDSALRDSQTCDLTGISNRRHIIRQLEDMAQLANESRTVVGFACLMDIDHFKKINDRLGHPAGDQALINFARHVRQIIRLRDSFGRVGGEEFLLLLPGLTLDESKDMMSGIFGRIRKTSLIPEHPEHAVTFSAGMSLIGVSDTMSSIYARCDKALYRAKSDGRDMLYIH